MIKLIKYFFLKNFFFFCKKIYLLFLKKIRILKRIITLTKWILCLIEKKYNSKFWYWIHLVFKKLIKISFTIKKKIWNFSKLGKKKIKEKLKKQGKIPKKKKGNLNLFFSLSKFLLYFPEKINPLKKILFKIIE